MPIDQGASQRRDLQNDGNSVIGQGSAITPKSASGDSYSQPSFGPMTAGDQGQSNARIGMTIDTTIIGSYPVETTSSKSRSQSQLTGVTIDNADLGSSVHGGVKQNIHGRLGVTPEVSSQGTSYVPSAGGPLTALHQPATVYFKLRARDSACVSPTYVEWVTTATPLSVGSYSGAMPCGGPLVELTILSIIAVG